MCNIISLHSGRYFLYWCLMKSVEKIIPVLLLVLYSLVVVHSLFPHAHTEGEKQPCTHMATHEHDSTEPHSHEHKEQTKRSLMDWLGLLGKTHNEQPGTTEQYYKFYKRSIAPPVIAVQICVCLLPAIHSIEEETTVSLPLYPLQDDHSPQDHSAFSSSPLRAPPASA